MQQKPSRDSSNIVSAKQWCQRDNSRGTDARPPRTFFYSGQPATASVHPITLLTKRILHRLEGFYKKCRPHSRGQHFYFVRRRV